MYSSTWSESSYALLRSTTSYVPAARAGVVHTIRVDDCTTGVTSELSMRQITAAWNAAPSTVSAVPPVVGPFGG